MRMVRNARPVSVVVGGTLVVAGSVGLWLAAMLQDDPGNGRRVLLIFIAAVTAVIQGMMLLSWNLRSRTMVLMLAQPADALPGILPFAVLVSATVALPELADPTNPALWIAVLMLCAAVLAVVPVEKAALSEVPPLRRGRFLDWLRWQNFGAGSLFSSVLFTAIFFTEPLRVDAFTPVIVVLAFAQATVSIWRITEHRQLSKAGVHLSALQISWLRVIHISRGHDDAVKELRTMLPKISSMQADTIIENLYRTEE